MKLFCAALALMCVAVPVYSQNDCKTIAPATDDGPIVSPENHTVLFEDADVRVLDVHSKPGTREVVHTHARPAVMYTDQQGAGTYRTPDGKGDRVRAADPNFKWRIFAIKPEGLHWTENTGDVPFHAVRVEFKHPGCGLAGWKAATPGMDDAAKAAIGSNTVIFENDDVRVIDIHLDAHVKDAFHTYPWRGFYYVKQGTALRETPGGDVSFPAGAKIVPASAGGYAMENIGDEPLHLIRFELKYGSVSK